MTDLPRRLLLVVAGGAIGTGLRLAVTSITPFVAGMPLGVLLVNVLGAFAIGILAARLPSNHDLRVFLGTGLLGGFTTYSAFAVDTVLLVQNAPLLAAAYIVLSLGLGLAAAVLGLRLGAPRSAP